MRLKKKLIMFDLNNRARLSIMLVSCFCFAAGLLSDAADAAIYSHGQSNKSNITDLYREIIVVECGDSLYTAEQFGGGYIGLAGGTTVAGHWINFSIWDNGLGDLNYVVEGPDSRLGGTVERFGNEGTGAKTTTKLRWEFNVLYKTYIKVEHIGGGSLISGWINRADSPEWYICGRIYVPNSTMYLGNGLLFLETLSDHEGLTRRENGATLGWVRNSSGWGAMTGLYWSCQSGHIERASGYNTSTIHYMTFEQDNHAPWYPSTGHQVPPGMVPTPSTAPDTMPAYDGPIEDISSCPTTDAISKDGWSLLYVDSEETAGEDGAATNAFDGDTATFWHTQWWGGSPRHPHEIQIDLGEDYSIDGFGYLPREGGSLNGTIDEYEFYVSTDGSNWGEAVAAGSWGSVVGMCMVEPFTPKNGRYVRLVALSEINDNAWTTVAELNVYGTTPDVFTEDIFTRASAIEGVDYAETVADTIFEGSVVDFSRVAGPLWLEVAADGTLSGVAGDSNVGLNSFTIRATDVVDGWFDDATFEITVYDTYAGELGLLDFAGFAGHWLDSGCVDVPACGGADLTGDGAVDTADLQRFAWLWLADYGTDGLAGHWTFDADGSDSAGDNDGTLVGDAAVTSGAAVGGGALSLDGDGDYVEMAGYDGVGGGAARTVSAWIKTTAVDGEIVTWGDLGFAGGSWIMRTNFAGLLRVEIGSGKIVGTTAINDGQWHHVAAVLMDDGTPNVSEIQLYVDGQLEVLTAQGNRVINTGSALPVRVGICVEQGGDRYFDGQIDDVRIYERAMTAGEVGTIFNQ